MRSVMSEKTVENLPFPGQEAVMYKYLLIGGKYASKDAGLPVSATRIYVSRKGISPP